MDYKLPGSSVHGIFQARILEWVVISYSRDLPNQGIEPASPASPVLQVDSLALHHLGSPQRLLAGPILKGRSVSRVDRKKVRTGN